jgi:hypothetical protein
VIAKPLQVARNLNEFCHFFRVVGARTEQHNHLFYHTFMEMIDLVIHEGSLARGQGVSFDKSIDCARDHRGADVCHLFEHFGLAPLRLLRKKFRRLGEMCGVIRAALKVRGHLDGAERRRKSWQRAAGRHSRHDEIIDFKLLNIDLEVGLFYFLSKSGRVRKCIQGLLSASDGRRPQRGDRG